MLLETAKAIANARVVIIRDIVISFQDIGIVLLFAGKRKLVTGTAESHVEF